MKISKTEAARQVAGGTPIAKGIWADAQNDLHFSIPELLEAFGWPDDAAHRAGVEQAIREVLAQQYPGVPIIGQEMP